VRQVAGQHGGAVAAEPAPGGGTLMRLRLPGAEPLNPAAGRLDADHRDTDADRRDGDHNDADTNAGARSPA